MAALLPDPFLLAAHGFRALGVLLCLYLLLLALACIPGWLRRRRDEAAARAILSDLRPPRPYPFALTPSPTTSEPRAAVRPPEPLADMPARASVTRPPFRPPALNPSGVPRSAFSVPRPQRDPR